MNTLFEDEPVKAKRKIPAPKVVYVSSGAEFSTCGKYRYKLWRIWNPDLPLAMCIGLNPSKATVVKNDATIGILSRMLPKLGYGGFYMMNLYAFISSKPKELLTCADPLGDNEIKLAEVEPLCRDVIACWGAFKQTKNSPIIGRYPNALCFGTSTNGSPFHPLALMYNGTQGNPQLFKLNNKTN